MRRPFGEVRARLGERAHRERDDAEAGHAGALEAAIAGGALEIERAGEQRARVDGLVLVEARGREHRQHAALGAAVPRLDVDGERLLEEPARLAPAGAHGGGVAEAGERAGHQGAIALGRGRGPDALEILDALVGLAHEPAQVAARLQRAGEERAPDFALVRGGERRVEHVEAERVRIGRRRSRQHERRAQRGAAQIRGRALGREEALVHRHEVLVLQPELAADLGVVARLQLRAHRLAEGEVVPGVPGVHGARFDGAQLGLAELADAGEQREASRRRLALLREEQRFVAQRREHVERRRRVGEAAEIDDLLRRVDAEAAAEGRHLRSAACSHAGRRLHDASIVSHSVARRARSVEGSWVRRAKRLLNRSISSAGASMRVRAAASSIASGRPSSRRTSLPMSASSRSLGWNVCDTARARSMKSSTASEDAGPPSSGSVSGPRSKSASPATPSRSREVTRKRVASSAAASRSGSTWAAARTTCSKLSRIKSSGPAARSAASSRRFASSSGSDSARSTPTSGATRVMTPSSVVASERSQKKIPAS